MPIDCRRRRLAAPSTPSPQMPTDALVSADQEIRGRIALRYVVVPAGPEEVDHLGGGRQSGLVVEAVGQRLQYRGALTIGTDCRTEERGAALARVAHALEGLVIGVESQQVVESVLQAEIFQRLVPVEDLAQFGGGHERGQDEID